MTPLLLRFDVNDEGLRRQFLDENVPAALGLLESETSPLWGHFTAQHMAEHVAWSLEMAAGIVKLPCHTPEEKLPKYRPFLYNELPVRRNFRSPVMDDTPPAYRFPDLDTAKSHILASIDAMKAHFKAHPDSTPVNPVFGPLGYEDWHRFQYKHIFHHLSQFGLIEALEG